MAGVNLGLRAWDRDFVWFWIRMTRRATDQKGQSYIENKSQDLHKSIELQKSAISENQSPFSEGISI